MSYLKQIDPSSVGKITKEKLLFGTDGTNTLSGTNLTFTLADRTDLTTEKSNLFMSFNLPITDEQKLFFTSGGTFQNTFFTGFNTDKIIVVEIPKNQYGELIDGKTIKLTIPQNSGSGATYLIDIYTTFEDLGGNRSQYNKKTSESSLNAEFFGQPRFDFTGRPINPKTDSNEFYESNIAFMFSDTIRRPLNNSGETWSENYSLTNNNPYTTSSTTNNSDRKNLFDFGLDKPIGIAYLDKGFFVLTDIDVVNNFVSGATATDVSRIANGNFKPTKYSFTGATNSGITTTFSSFSYEYALNLLCIAGSNEFYSTLNPTAAQLEGNPLGSVTSYLGEDKPILVTELGIYDENNNLLALAKPDKPISKYWYETIAFLVKIKI
jgi:hypothetical protein